MENIILNRVLKKTISPEELKRLFIQSNHNYADEEILVNSSINDLNTELNNQLLTLEVVLENRELLRDGCLTLSGSLIFGKNPQRYNKSCYIDCVYFDGNDITVNHFISKEIINGTFAERYNSMFQFL